jgi:hypothetical protein
VFAGPSTFHPETGTLHTYYNPLALNFLTALDFNVPLELTKKFDVTTKTAKTGRK